MIASRPSRPGPLTHDARIRPRRRPAPLHAVLLLAAPLASCGDPGAEQLAEGDVALAATTEDLFTVGALSGEDWETLSRVSAVAFDADGNLYILDSGSYQVLVVDDRGQLLRTVGSQGGGPGELSSPMGMAVMDDGRTVVYDMGMPGAFEVYDANGEFVASTTFDIARGSIPGFDIRPVDDGRVLSTGGMRFAMNGRGGGNDGEPEAVQARPLSIYALDGSEPELLYEAWDLPPAGEGERVGGEAEGGMRLELRMGRQRAFTPGLHVGVMSDGQVAVVDSIGYRVKLIAPDGSVDSALGRAILPEPVTAAIEEAERARQLEAAQSGGGRVRVVSSFGQIPQELQDQLREAMVAQVESMDFPDEIPVIEAMSVDAEDRIWVARTAPGGSGDGPIDLLSASEGYIGTLPLGGPRIPDAFGPDGLMAYIETGEMDVPMVRVVRLVEVGPA